MNPPTVRFPSSEAGGDAERFDALAHEVICGRRPDQVRILEDRLAQEHADPGVEPWLVDPGGVLGDWADKVSRYAHSNAEIDTLVTDVQQQSDDRGRRLVGTELLSWIPGDLRLELPVLSLTIADAPTVLASEGGRQGVELVLREARKSGIRVRLVASDLSFASFGGSEVIRSVLRSHGRLVGDEQVPGWELWSW
jgi:hypothetical protein